MKPTKKQILLFLISFLCISCNEIVKVREITKILFRQSPEKFDANNLIGFACYSEGVESNPVRAYSELIKNRKYAVIIEKLKSENAAEKYLSTIVCKRLEQKKLITLTKSEFDQINDIMSSQKIIIICAGCTEEEELTIEDMFSDNFLTEDIEEWLSNNIK